MGAELKLSALVGTAVVLSACNAILGLEEKTRDQGIASGGTGTGGSHVGGSSNGGSVGIGGTTGGTEAGAGGEPGGEGGSSGDGCTPDDERGCGEVDRTLLGNCAQGRVRCGSNGSWGACSIQPLGEDSCEEEGDDADCNGTPNSGCPCVTGATRQCGVTDQGRCEYGTQECVAEIWNECADAVFPTDRDCQSSDDNDCDGQPDDIVDEACPCASDGQHTCLEAPATDWTGPIALATVPASAPAPSCNSTYDQDVLSLFGDLDDGAATCGCACGTPSGMSCSQPVEIHFIQGTVSPTQCLLPMSVNDEPEYEINANQCAIVSSTGTYKPIRPRFSASGSCTADPTVDIGPAGWTRRMVACATAAPNGSGCASEELCMPNLTGSFEAWCIYRQGEHACPAGSYSEQSVYYEAFDDQRACSPCGCATPMGTCQGHVQFTTGAPDPNGCGGLTNRGRVNFGACGTITAPATASPTVTPEGSCDPMGGSLEGDVVTEGAVTVCCRP